MPQYQKWSFNFHTAFEIVLNAFTFWIFIAFQLVFVFILFHLTLNFACVLFCTTISLVIKIFKIKIQNYTLRYVYYSILLAVQYGLIIRSVSYKILLILSWLKRMTHKWFNVNRCYTNRWSFQKNPTYYSGSSQYK